MITHSHQTRTSEQQRKIKKRSHCLPRTCHQHITSERQQQQQQKIKRWLPRTCHQHILQLREDHLKRQTTQ
jgi:hypothetical protein